MGDLPTKEEYKRFMDSCLKRIDLKEQLRDVFEYMNSDLYPPNAFPFVSFPVTKKGNQS